MINSRERRQPLPVVSSLTGVLVSGKLKEERRHITRWEQETEDKTAAAPSRDALCSNISSKQTIGKGKSNEYF